MSEKRGVDYVMVRGEKVRILKRGIKVRWQVKWPGKKWKPYSKGGLKKVVNKIHDEIMSSFEK